MFSTHRGQRGFSLPELMITIGLAGTLMAIALPIATDVTATTKLNEATRLIERELQDARLRAVATNSVLRVRTNCPAAGYIRTVEVIGTGADTAANRCMPANYPYPPDNDLITLPNYDGPVRTIPNRATVTNSVIQFSPDGTARLVVNGTVTNMAAAQTITVTRNGKSRTVTINAAGKVQLQ